MEQKCWLLNLKYKDDPTVIQLYTIAKNSLEYQIQNRTSAVDVLIDSNMTLDKQFKRIIEECDQDKESRDDIKRIKTLASRSLYTETCLNKHLHQDPSDLDSLPTPEPLPLSSQPTVPPESRLDHMKFAAAFKEEYRLKFIILKVEDCGDLRL